MICIERLRDLMLPQPLKTVYYIYERTDVNWRKNYMKNPYLFGYLPFITIIVLSLTFGVYAVSQSMELFSAIGVYNGMREFLSDFEIKVFLLIVSALLFFMVFSALKLIGETIHELAMLFFSKDRNGETIHIARGGYVIFFFGALATMAGIQSIFLLILILLITVSIYFIYTVYKMSNYLSFVGLIGFIVFEIVVWAVFLAAILFAVVKLYNSILASLPFAN